VILLLLLAQTPQLGNATEAVAALRRPDGVEAVQAACRGRLRHELRDHPGLLAEVRRQVEAGQKAPLELFRCFTAPKFATVLEVGLRGAPELAAYSAEVAARFEAPAAVAPVLAVAEASVAECEGPLQGAAKDRCVWLTYAPGTGVATDPALAQRARKLALQLLQAQSAKVREVAVETLAAAGTSADVAALKLLISKEKSGAFAEPNDPALLKRFESRAVALSKKK